MQRGRCEPAGAFEAGTTRRGTKPMEGQGALEPATALEHYGLVNGVKPRRRRLHCRASSYASVGAVGSLMVCPGNRAQRRKGRTRGFYRLWSGGGALCGEPQDVRLGAGKRGVSAPEHALRGGRETAMGVERLSALLKRWRGAPVGWLGWAASHAHPAAGRPATCRPLPGGKQGGLGGARPGRIRS